LLPSFDSGEDATWSRGPDEGLGIGICLGEKAIDCGFEFGDGSEHAALETPMCEFGIRRH
jgi:hypothetical protein